MRVARSRNPASSEDVVEVIVEFHKFLATGQLLAALGAAENLEWDIHLLEQRRENYDVIGSDACRMAKIETAAVEVTPKPRLEKPKR